MYTILGLQACRVLYRLLLSTHFFSISIDYSLSLSNIVVISLHYLCNKEVKEGPLQGTTCAAPGGGGLGEEPEKCRRQYHQRQAESIEVVRTSCHFELPQGQ